MILYHSKYGIIEKRMPPLPKKFIFGKMELSQLEPEFLKIIDENTNKRIDDITQADGIVFLCPVCFKNNGNSNIGTHSIICWQPHVPQERTPKPGRWKFEGTGYEDLSLVAGSSSILLNGGCNAHFFIRKGKIEF